jgi:cholesterol oxidase
MTARGLAIGFSKNLSRPADKEVRTKSIDLTLPWFKRLSGQPAPVGCSFLLGSCRHPGSPFERDLCNKVMVAMLGQVKDGKKWQGVDHVLLVGDQIYADATADAFDTREPGERFVGRYRDLFQSEGFEALARSVPIRMAIDDHEISNNWPGRNRPNALAQQNVTSPGEEELSRPGDERDNQRLIEELEIARESAYCYEILAAPGDRELKSDGQPRKPLWYQFESGGLPFFVLDCRTQRVQRRRDIAPNGARMLGNRQRAALEKWLETHGDSEEPKFIVSSTPIAPVLADHVRKPSLWRNADNWFGYPASLEWLARLFTRVKPKNLVFLSGDYHFSATAQLWFFDRQCREASAWQVVSSGLYAPMPFANERFEDYRWDYCEAAPIAGTESVLGFKATRVSQAQSHFLRVDASKSGGKWHVDVRAIGADGKEIVIAIGDDGKEVKSVHLF